MVDVACRKCNIIKDSSFDFYWSKGERQRRCKKCMKAYTTEWQRQTAQKIKDAKKDYQTQLASKRDEK